MQKPIALVKLLDELEPSEHVKTTSDSSARFLFDNDDTLTLNPEDCEKIFGTEEQANILIGMIEKETKSSIDTAVLELRELKLPDPVTLLLEEKLAMVEEL